MNTGRIFVDCFSGAAADLPKANRETDDVLNALRKDPRVSTWDMSELQWLRSAIKYLEGSNLIVRDMSEPFPWLRYNVIGEIAPKELES